MINNILLFDKYYYDFKNNCLLDASNDNKIVDDNKIINMYKTFVMTNYSNLFVKYNTIHNYEYKEYEYSKDCNTLFIKNYGTFKFCYKYTNIEVTVKKIGSDNYENIDFENEKIIMKFYVNMLYNWIISDNGVFVIDTNLIPVLKYHLYDKIYYYDTEIYKLNYVSQKDVFPQIINDELISRCITYEEIEKNFKEYVLKNLKKKEDLPEYEFIGNKIILYINGKKLSVHKIVYNISGCTRFIKNYINDELSNYFSELSKINYIYTNDMINWSYCDDINDISNSIVEINIDDINVDDIK